MSDGSYGKRLWDNLNNKPGVQCFTETVVFLTRGSIITDIKDADKAFLKKKLSVFS